MPLLTPLRREGSTAPMLKEANYSQYLPHSREPRSLRGQAWETFLQPAAAPAGNPSRLTLPLPSFLLLHPSSQGSTIFLLFPSVPILHCSLISLALHHPHHSFHYTLSFVFVLRWQRINPTFRKWKDCVEKVRIYWCDEESTAMLADLWGCNMLTMTLLTIQPTEYKDGQHLSTSSHWKLTQNMRDTGAAILWFWCNWESESVLEWSQGIEVPLLHAHALVALDL